MHAAYIEYTILLLTPYFVVSDIYGTDRISWD